MFHKTGDPGFSGISFQAALSWESLIAIYDDKTLAAQCPNQPILDLPEGQFSDTTQRDLCGNTDYACVLGCALLQRGLGRDLRRRVRGRGEDVHRQVPAE